MTCTTPPKGWKCSREFGHDGPCAAYEEFPYDTYVEKAISGLSWPSHVHKIGEKIVFEEPMTTLTLRELKSMLADAWLSGLDHSLELLEKK